MNNDNTRIEDIPAGLGMAFAQNTKAMLRFAEMNDAQRSKVIAHAHTIRSKQEMQAFVSGLTVDTDMLRRETE